MLYDRFSTGAGGVSSVGNRVLNGLMHPQTARHPQPKGAKFLSPAPPHLYSPAK
jgi:hypothetical protein